MSVGFPAVVQVYVVDDAEDFAHPRLPPVVPPRILEMVRDTGQAVQGQGDPVVALAFVRPVKQGNEFVAGEVHLAGRKGILELGELDQGEDDRVVRGGWQAILLRAFDDPLAEDDLLLAVVVNLVLELEACFACDGTIAKRGHGELGKVHLVLADAKQLGEGFHLLQRWRLFGTLLGHASCLLDFQKSNNRLQRQGRSAVDAVLLFLLVSKQVICYPQKKALSIRTYGKLPARKVV